MCVSPIGNAVKDSRSRALPWNALTVRLRLTPVTARRSLESRAFQGRARERGSDRVGRHRAAVMCLVPIGRAIVVQTLSLGCLMPSSLRVNPTGEVRSGDGRFHP